MFVFRSLKSGITKSSSKTKASLLVMILLFIGGLYYALKPESGSTPQYKTETAEKGTLVVSVTASGQVTSTNARSVTTTATGVVKQLSIKDGDTVKIGQQIATLELDQEGKQKAAQALASYQGAKSSLESARANLYSLQSKMFAANQTFMNKAVAEGLATTDPNFIQQDADWLASEALYKNQQNAINQAQNALNSSWLSYQQTSPIIYAPISGKVTGLSLQPGTVISASGDSTSTKIANIQTEALPTVSINLTEIDVAKVHVDDKATITFDSLADETYSGRVVSVDTVGSVSSGVTTYPVTISLDSHTENIFPNMSANASIISQTKDNVLLVPISAVQTFENKKTVRILSNGQVQTKSVEVGLNSDTQAEIISGLNEGDRVITSMISTSNQSSGQTGSVFSSLGGARGGISGGNQVRIAR